jgi:hypothetical protein
MDLNGGEPSIPAAIRVDGLQETEIKRFAAGLRGMAGDYGLA